MTHSRLSNAFSQNTNSFHRPQSHKIELAEKLAVHFYNVTCVINKYSSTRARPRLAQTVIVNGTFPQSKSKMGFVYDS